ncbi:queuosine precursor transporter [Phaeovibrio sulfidiphilus]|uniref:Probable queuosine precursor transporter n=1 Tax=Phaeovibrio sulfidiphilus TaxID=1220600 RepID=A0A8J7CD48_9PROT|nr:queuosine precursor transporter [Phaeovibrio sulfidiphilus]MBE1236694.1 queuosine precursor transporter [Phaeovibrio sulfidiphilus]
MTPVGFLRSSLSLLKAYWLPAGAMTLVVVVSNILVAFPINDWLTWAAFTYPVAFLVTDLTNRACGPKRARSVAYVGFSVAVALCLLLADPRIALASGSAFLSAQLLDIFVFDRLRNRDWWIAPLVSGVTGSVLDTVIFFSLAFYGTQSPTLWMTLAAGDLMVKLAFALFLLAPFRMLITVIAARPTPLGPLPTAHP